jgi:hypothetical protein
VRRQLAIAAAHRDAPFLHRLKVRASGDHDHVLTAPRESGADQTTDRSGADDGDSHCPWMSAEATFLR